MPRVDLTGVRYSGAGATARIQSALRPYIIEHYNQSERIRAVLGANSNVAGGVCLALSLNWIRLHQSAKHAPRLGIDGLLTTDSVIVKARGVQLNFATANVSRSGTPLDNLRAGLKHACALTHMSINGALRRFGFPDAGLGAALETVRGYFVLGLNNGFGSGHALASYFSSGKVLGYGRHLYLFDSNIGEFKIPEADIDYFLGALADYYFVFGANFVFCDLAGIKA